MDPEHVYSLILPACGLKTRGEARARGGGGGIATDMRFNSML